MERFRHILPSADALVVFEAAARHLSFTRAAGELSVTQAAVSRRMQALEHDLGFQLFRRTHRRLELTPQGHELFETVSQSLRHIAETAERLSRTDDRNRVSIAANNSVAFLWLRSRLARYMQDFPEVDVQLVATDRLHDFQEDGMDLAIRYGAGKWAETDATLLFEEEVFPVCAPAYLNGRSRRITSDALSQETLLHIVPRGPDWITWAQLLSALGIGLSETVEQGPRFNNFPLLLQAALNGQGMAIGSARLLDEHLARGDLVRPVGGSLRTGRGYYLVRSTDRTISPQACHLAAWLAAAT